jgi:hypothetical protein
VGFDVKCSAKGITLGSPLMGFVNESMFEAIVMNDVNNYERVQKTSSEFTTGVYVNIPQR